MIIGTSPSFLTKKKIIPARGWKKKLAIAQTTFSPVLVPSLKLKTMNQTAQTSIKSAPKLRIMISSFVCLFRKKEAGKAYKKPTTISNSFACRIRGKLTVYRAAAPETTSMISLVIAA